VQGYEIGDYISEQYHFQKKEVQDLQKLMDELQPRSEIKRKKKRK
jgi:hypothetical protein